MKQGTGIQKAVIIVLAVAVVVYLAVSAWRSFTNPFSTFLSYSYTVEDTVEATGIIVRAEVVLPAASGTVDILPAEGARVAKGETVALSYQSTDAITRKQELARLNLELEQMQHARETIGITGDSTNLTQQVLSAITELHTAVAGHSLTGIEDQSSRLKTLVAKQGYSGADAESATALNESIAQTQASIQALEKQSAQDTGKVTVSQAGIFSAHVDGWEELITPAMLDTMMPAALDKLVDQSPDVTEGSAVGKLITDITWYYVFTTDEETGGRLWEGASVSARFSRDWSGEITMKVERISDVEDGQVAIILSSNRYLSQTTLLRKQSVDLVFGSVTGVRVPKKALRMLQTTVKDEETGVETVQEQLGVYAVVGAQAEFKPVSVLREEGDYCLVQPENTGIADKKVLRAGDEIIVAAEDLYTGKVIQ